MPDRLKINASQSIFSWRDLSFDTSNPNVYPPKPASLLLAEHAIAWAKPGDAVLDDCAGSGVVGIAVAKHVPGTKVTLADLNPVALNFAKQNAERNGVTVEIVQSDLYSAFPNRKFQMIAIHPPAIPYLPDHDWGMCEGMAIATNGGSDGSELVSRSIHEAKPHLADGGQFLLLFPHWSNIERAHTDLKATYAKVNILAQKEVEFFPVGEGRPSQQSLDHLRRLAERGIIEITWKDGVPWSTVSVIQAKD